MVIGRELPFDLEPLRADRCHRTSTAMQRAGENIGFLSESWEVIIGRGLDWRWRESRASRLFVPASVPDLRPDNLNLHVQRRVQVAVLSKYTNRTKHPTAFCTFVSFIIMLQSQITSVPL